MAHEIAEKQTHSCLLAEPKSGLFPGKTQRRSGIHWSLPNMRGSSEWVKVPVFAEGIDTS